MTELEQLKQTLSNNGYEYIDLIGSGAFASVYLCKSKQYNHQFAIKQVLKKNLSQHEIDSLISLIHPYIIKLYVTFSDENYQYLVMEYCPKGTIKELDRLEFDQFIFYAKQILEVLEYCHSQNIAHRDIKPENIFLDQYNHIKLADFGLSSKFQDQQLSNMKCGSLTFCSPEILSNSEFDPFKADIWALGISFYFMVTGHFPYENRNNQSLRDMIVNSQISFFNYKVDSQIQYLIRKMTTKNPLFRPSASQLLKFSIFQQTNTGKINKSISLLSPSNFGFQRRTSYQAHFTFQDNNNNRNTEPQAENCVQNEAVLSNSKKLTSIRSFKSFNFNINSLKHNCQHFVKYD